MNNELTSRQFWLDYWESKDDLIFEFPKDYPFVEHIRSLVTKNNCKNILEIGGFPGYYLTWVKRYLNLEVSLLDFVIHPKILNSLETTNKLAEGSIEIIEADLFNFEAKKNFDMVLSNGLIEHFLDTKEIIQKHVEHLNSGGVLLITLPNFKSLNGWFQKQFDNENYKKHNIECMDLSFLKSTCIDLGLSEIQVKYTGRFMLWFEREEEKHWSIRLLKKMVWLPLKIFIKFIPIETKSFSPFIQITAIKP